MPEIWLYGIFVARLPKIIRGIFLGVDGDKPASLREPLQSHQSSTFSFRSFQRRHQALWNLTLWGSPLR